MLNLFICIRQSTLYRDYSENSVTGEAGMRKCYSLNYASQDEYI